MDDKLCINLENKEIGGFKNDAQVFVWVVGPFIEGGFFLKVTHNFQLCRGGSTPDPTHYSRVNCTLSPISKSHVMCVWCEVANIFFLIIKSIQDTEK